MNIDNNRLLALVNPVSEIAEQAGDKIMKIYREGFEVEEKKDRSPLTTADMASHNFIYNRLTELTPDIPILSEESRSIPYSERSSWETYWLIDPLDGTREFIKRNDEFTVNIALVKKQSAVLGVVYIPAQEICYYASKDNGAFKRPRNSSPTNIHTRHSSPSENPTICGSRSHAGKSLRTLLAQIGNYKLISFGSSIKTCLVADGSADIYPRFGPTSEWDTAAAHCIVDEAGGTLVDLELNIVQYNNKDSLLNPSFIVVGDFNSEWREFISEYVKNIQKVIK